MKEERSVGGRAISQSRLKFQNALDTEKTTSSQYLRYTGSLQEKVPATVGKVGTVEENCTHIKSKLNPGFYFSDSEVSVLLQVEKQNPM